MTVKPFRVLLVKTADDVFQPVSQVAEEGFQVVTCN